VLYHASNRARETRRARDRQIETELSEYTRGAGWEEEEEEEEEEEKEERVRARAHTRERERERERDRERERERKLTGAQGRGKRVGQGTEFPLVGASSQRGQGR